MLVFVFGFDGDGKREARYGSFYEYLFLCLGLGSSINVYCFLLMCVLLTCKCLLMGLCVGVRIKAVEGL